jgi:4-coumarate--CoA ligase
MIEKYEPISDDMMSLPNDTKESVCLITETSGSTGPSKAVQFTHYSVVSALEITSLPMIFGYTLNDVISCHSQFSHQIAIFQVFTGIATGSKIAIMPQLNYNQFINYVQKYLITAALLPPPVIIRLAKDPEDRDISSLTKIISFGSVLHKNIGNKFTSRYKHVNDLRQGLFHTECMAPISLMVKNSTDFDSIGVPTPNTKVKIINPETGEQLPVNQTGIICVHREDALSKGYLNNSKTLIDSDGWLRTRDLGFYDEDGMLYFVENIDLMIRCSGLLISPSELEGLLLSHSNVCEAAVIGIPDANEERIPTAFVVLNPSVVGKISGYDIEQFVNGMNNRFIYFLF